MKLNLPLPKLHFGTNQLFIGVLIAAVVLGSGTGYLLSQNKEGASFSVVPSENPKTAQQDTRTFRDFAEGMIQKIPPSKNPNEYIEGTHVLVREGALPVTLTSSVVDLTQYEGKKVRVLGETQKALKAGWLMDIGKVEVIN